MSMQIATVRRYAFSVFAAVAACLLLVPAAFAAAPAGNVSLKGAVVRGDKATPVTGARVYAVHLDTKQVFTSAPSASAVRFFMAPNSEARVTEYGALQP